MGKILEYSNYGSYPREDDLIFFCDYNDDNANPTTKKLLISDLNKKLQIWAATGAGLKLTDDGGNYGVFIKDGGNVGVGNADPTYRLDVQYSGTTTFRIRSGNTNDAIIRLDQQDGSGGTTNQATVGYDHSSSLLKLGNHSAFGTTNHLVINTNGNVGIGHTTPNYPLDVSGKLASTGSYPVVLDGGTGEITSTNSSLNVNKTAGQNVTFMYYDTDGSTVNPALSIKASNKRTMVGNDTTPDSKLHIKEADEATNPVIKIENTTTSGHTAIELTRNGVDEFITWNGSVLAIANTNIAASSATANFQTGKIGLGTTTFTRKLNVTDSNNIGAQFVSSSTAGSRIILETGPSDAAATYSSLVGFPLYISSVKKVGWMSGALRLSDVNYFGIHYSDTTFGLDSTMAFNGTLANNLFYIDTTGNVTIKGNAAADAFYDKGGTTVGNYCRGRFLQTFAVGMRADNQGSVFPALNTIMNLNTDGSTHDGTAGYNDGAKTPDARYMSRAPFAGKLQRIDLTTYFPSADVDSATITPTFMFYSGSSLPSAGGDSGMGTTNSAYVSLGTLADDTSHTLGFNSFTDAAGVLEFSAGDYLAVAIDVNTTSGFFYANLALTMEFLITD
jgi:hypothetical protein